MAEPNIVSQAITGPLPRFKLSLRSGENATRSALAQVMNAISPLSLDAEESMTVELIMAEALNNIVEHAYPDNNPEGPIHIDCTHLADGLHFTIVDQGFPMPNGETPIGICPAHDVEVEDLPEGGFGWFLIKDLAKDVQYKRIEDKNQLRLRIAVAYGRQ